MRVFLAGATGVVGRRLMPMLIEAGHEVIGTTRTPGNQAALEQAGAHPTLMDALDADSVHHAVRTAAPEVIVHEATALHGGMNLKKFDRSFATTNQLRRAGTAHLLAAAHAAGTTRMIAQSFTGWTNPRAGGDVTDETTPLDSRPTAASQETLAAIAYLERTVTEDDGLDGLALRYGMLYGPGTGLGDGGDMLALVRKRQLPLVGTGAGVWAFLHIDDAARATVAALDHGSPGVYNIVDDEPAPVSAWLPHLAHSIGAQPPRRLPAWLARPAIGEHGVSMMTRIRGASNAKAKHQLNWQPNHPSWRQGFRDGLS